MSQKSMGLLAAWGLCFVVAFSDASGTTLAATQLTGLKGVDIEIMVKGDLPEDEARELESALEERLSASFTEAGLPLGGKESESFYFIVEARYMGNPTEDGAVALSMSARLREEVILRRDRRLGVPGGGGLTWWKDALVVTRLDKMREEVDRTADFLTGAFVEVWRVENPGSRPK